jgi:stage II sporulation protein P
LLGTEALGSDFAFKSVQGALAPERSGGGPSFAALAFGADLGDVLKIESLALPMAASLETHRKKYAYLYDASIRKSRVQAPEAPPAPTATPVPIPPDMKPVLEMDMSNQKPGENIIVLRNETDYGVDTDEMAKGSRKLKIEGGAPKVLVIHAHTTEAYAAEDLPYYDANAEIRSEDVRYNVARVGDEIADVLNQSGIPTVHDRELNDYPSYNGSYAKALRATQDYLEKYPSIEVVLDIHRDYTVNGEGANLKPVVTLDGQKTAQIMPVVGTDANGLEHPNWRENMQLAVLLETKMNRLYPRLARPINLRNERFNGHATKGSLILEVGSSANTLEEAARAGRLAGKALAEVLK